MQAITKWLRQPSSITGISAAIAALSGVASGQLSWGQAVPLLSGALVAILLPDNSGARADAQALAGEVVSLMEKRTGGAS